MRILFTIMWSLCFSRVQKKYPLLGQNQQVSLMYSYSFIVVVIEIQNKASFKMLHGAKSGRLFVNHPTREELM